MDDDYLYMNAISQLPSWVEFIIAKAPDSFKANSAIKDFYENFQRAQKGNERYGNACAGTDADRYGRNAQQRYCAADTSRNGRRHIDGKTIETTHYI